MIREDPVSADDLDVPLGKDKKRKRLTLPVPAPQIVVVALGISVLVVGLWAIFAEDPYGGEPIAVVTTRPVKETNADAAQGGSEPNPSRYDGPVGGAKIIAAAPAVPAGAKTVTIIDGSSGKSQQVVLPGSPDAKLARAAPDQKLLEQTKHGTIPKIGPGGERPSVTYARPVTPPPGKADAPRIAIIIGGLGISASATAEALAKLPAPVSLAFAPYGADVGALATRALSENHEVLLQAPMEPFDYPDNDPGPQTLLTSLTPDQNIDRLHWLMSRMHGYVGIASFMGTRFTASEAALAPVLRETAKRGLIFVDDGGSTRSVAGQVAGGNNLPFAKADIVLDVTPTPAEIERALNRLELLAREKGSAVGYATALPATVTRIAEWAKKAEGRGFLLIPISMIAVKNRPS